MLNAELKSMNSNLTYVTYAVRGQRHHLVAGRRWSLLCSGAVLCLKASKEGIQLIQQGDGAVTGLWWGLVWSESPATGSECLCCR